MKRFVAALSLFVAIAYAQDNDDTASDEGDSGEEEGVMDSIGSWFSSETDPVDWESITANPGDMCKLGGTYGWYQTTGIDSVFVKAIVSDCMIPSDA